MTIADNIARIRERIDAAARRCGRDPHSIKLMAVSKTFPAEAISLAYNAGVRLFGESRVQEFEGKAQAVRRFTDAEFALIGHLQTNKVNKAVELFSSIQSLDSLKLARKLNDAAAAEGAALDALIEINIGAEASKHGFSEGSPELDALLAAAPELPHLRIRGLMAVPPYADDPEFSRDYLRSLAELRDYIASRKLPAVEMDELSMGMSHDFEVAIEEGSTCVRIGTAIFGERQTL